jgi:hypothetical protein
MASKGVPPIGGETDLMGTIGNGEGGAGAAPP